MWREEREWDRAVFIASAFAGGDAMQILGRELGDSRVPGYRPGDGGRR